VVAAIIELALQKPELSPRELATAFVDQQRYFISEASVYRLLKARGLIARPAFILLKAADHFAQPTTAINQLWQTDFLTCGWSAGAGFTYRPYSMIFPATLWPGSSAPP
jgi:putative transposase